MAIIEEISITSHLGHPALNIRIDRGKGWEDDVQHLVCEYLLDDPPFSIEAFIKWLKWLIPYLEKEQEKILCGPHS